MRLWAVIARARAENSRYEKMWTAKWDQGRELWAVYSSKDTHVVAWFADSREAWAACELLNAWGIDRLV